MCRMQKCKKNILFACSLAWPPIQAILHSDFRSKQERGHISAPEPFIKKKTTLFPSILKVEDNKVVLFILLEAYGSSYSHFLVKLAKCCLTSANNLHLRHGNQQTKLVCKLGHQIQFTDNTHLNWISGIGNHNLFTGTNIQAKNVHNLNVHWSQSVISHKL